MQLAALKVLLKANIIQLHKITFVTYKATKSALL